MSRRIARLLDESEHQVTKLIGKLEDKNGYPSQDARLLAETVQKIRNKLADLNLDPDDTTGEELYHALQVKFERDSRLFDEFFGAGRLGFDQKSAKAVQLMEPYAKEAHQWALKSKAAKDVIRQLPPKRLMKRLNYRSVESLLKRKDLSEVYLASACIESDNWVRAHKRLVSKLDQTAFEIQSVKLVNIDEGVWGDVGSSDQIAHNEEIAALGIWPSKMAQNLSLLSMVLMLAEGLGQYSEISESRTAARLNGVVAWWSDMDHLVTELSNETVSLNLKDCLANQFYGNDFKSRSLAHGRAAFWRELVSRYENLPNIDGLFDGAVKQKIEGLKFAAPEPAYEFVEDF